MSRTPSYISVLGVAALACGPAETSSDANDAVADSTGTDGADETTAAATMATESSGATSTAAADEDSTGGGASVEPGPDASVAAFEAAHVFWLGWDDGQNMRALDVDVVFPDPDLAYTSATLHLGLSCPDGACDWWDRKGSIGVVEGAGTDDERLIEIARFVTPYRVGGEWALDVTPLRPLLSGPRTLRVTIDTWVGPGHPNGNGWLVDARVDFVGGVPDERPIEVHPLWPLSNIALGDPATALQEQVPEATVALPTSASRLVLWSVISGHGQGNADNCAEFCPLAHGYDVGGTTVQRTVWRDDCGDNPIDTQQGTWTLARAGWCPGDFVAPWVQDVSAALAQRGELTTRYEIQDYVNTCRPDAPVCEGCALGTGCEYDDGNHTPPSLQMSAALIVYEAIAN
ncbi:MAG: peptide-N-glycosidase F-related protein [Myxococcota bacterium]